MTGWLILLNLWTFAWALYGGYAVGWATFWLNVFVVGLSLALTHRHNQDTKRSIEQDLLTLRENLTTSWGTTARGSAPPPEREVQ